MDDYYLFKYQVVGQSSAYDPESDAEDEGFVTHVEGQIICDAEGAKSQTVGSMKAQILRFSRMFELEAMGKDVGISRRDICDNQSSELLGLYDTLFRNEVIRSDVARLLGWEADERDILSYGDLLFIEHVTIARAHCGHGVGLAAVIDLLREFGPGCDCAAMLPSPLSECDREPTDAGRDKLCRYWAALGFQRVRDSDYFIRSPSIRNLPTAREALAQYRSAGETGSTPR